MNHQVEQTIVPNEVYNVIMALASKLEQLEQVAQHGQRSSQWRARSTD